jgi:hypothetical protein
MTTLTTVSKPKRIPLAMNGTEAAMSDGNFNYSTRAFRQHAKQPGFWHYALKVHCDGSRYEIRLNKATLRRMPIAA